ncbi:MAG: pyruvate dehydrogenase complex dihydrolipoamide acetyltransferase [Leptospiraceae bacterium]|nr:pyruvate dehydrogenase complex dihydrolipoamide acetyltransferase [Leptospiraceae bacterium]MCZ8345258.1 pyruvate dehydrogenase complex dihydrolipoamide acetyltransferase [Leptospiraceae bacterium]
MAKIAEMTQLSPTMTEGTIVNWLKKVGDTVSPGEILAEVETDKAVMEMEAYDSGTLLAIVANVGSKVAVGLPVAIIGQANEDITKLLEESKNKIPQTSVRETKPVATESLKEKIKEPSKDKEEKQSQAKEEIKLNQENVFSATGRILASPLAKSIALEKSIDLKKVQGSGPAGRILQKDVLAYFENPNINHKQISSNSHFEVREDLAKPISGMRKVIAERLTSSKVNLPHFYLNLEIDASAIVSFREKFNIGLKEFSKNDSSLQKISINDCIVKAVALSLNKHPAVNASWQNDKIIEYGRIDIGIAVSIEDGLITPVLRNTNQMSLIGISQEIKSLAEQAKKRKLKPEQFTNSTFTISNLGMFGISFFTAIINEPESAILAVGAIEDKPVVKNGQVVAGRTMSLTLSCDHRVVDGAEGAKFLGTLKKYLENPELLAS